MEKNTEHVENAILTGQGIKVNLGKTEVQITPPTLGVLDRMSASILKMKPTNEEDLVSSFWREVTNNVQYCAEAIAIAILGENYTPEKQKEMVTLVKENLTAQKLMEVYLEILKLCDIVNFTGTIRLMSGSSTTSPNRVESKTDFGQLSA